MDLDRHSPVAQELHQEGVVSRLEEWTEAKDIENTNSMYVDMHICM